MITFWHRKLFYKMKGDYVCHLLLFISLVQHTSSIVNSSKILVKSLKFKRTGQRIPFKLSCKQLDSTRKKIDVRNKLNSTGHPIGDDSEKQYYVIKKNIRRLTLDGYDKVIGPSSQGKQPPLEVKFTLQIKKLDHVSTKDQNLKVKAMIKMVWNDPIITWKRGKHDGISQVHFMSDEIWTPDINLINNEDEDRDKKVKPLKLAVNNKGRVTWRFPVTLLSSCTLNVRRWPIDTQECTLSFGSPSYTVKRMMVSGVNKTYKGSISSGEWSLRNIRMHQGFYDYGDAKNYSCVHYKLTLDRKPAYTLFYLSPPAIILTLLTFMSFCIPSESGERIGFVTTILLTMMVFLLLLPEYLPRTSDGLPVLGILLIVAMIVIAIVLMATIVVVKFYHCPGVPPSWLQKLACPPSVLKGVCAYFYPSKRRPEVTSVLPYINPDVMELANNRPFEAKNALNHKKVTWQDLSIKLNCFLVWFILCAFLMTCAFIFSMT